MYAGIEVTQQAFAQLSGLPQTVPLGGDRDLLIGIAPFVIGLIVVVALIAAVWYGMRLRARGDQRPSGPETPHPKDPVEYETRHREGDEVPHDGRRRMPYEFKDYDSDTHQEEHGDQPPPTWDENSSGGFGSGGPGRA